MKLALIMGVLLLSTVAGSAWYIDRLQDDIGTLKGNQLILDNTDWKPSIDFDKGLDLTIDWFKNFKNLFTHDIYHI